MFLNTFVSFVLAIAPFLVILIGVRSEFAILPCVYILLLPPKEEFQYSS